MLGPAATTGVVGWRLGAIAHREGDDARAQHLLEQTLATCREIGRKGDMISLLIELGRVTEGRGDRERARSLYEQSLALSREIWYEAGAQTARQCLDHLARGPSPTPAG